MINGLTFPDKVKMSKNIFRRLLQEPLLHFLIIGGLIFVFLPGAHAPDSVDAKERIVISSTQLEQMSAAWARRWLRPPTEAELNGMIDEAIREQVLYREALAIGLDRDDVVVRRHLRQKYEFLTQDLAVETEPDDATLRTYHQAHADRYARAGRLTFSQILFSTDRRGASAETDAAQTLADLQSATGPQAAERLGDMTSLPSRFEAIEAPEVEAMFGPEFTAALLDLDPGRWVGPIASGYGLHLVWLSEKVPGARLPFDDVRKRIRDDWIYDQRRAANEAVYRALLERYEVIVEPVDTSPDKSGGGS